MKSSQVYKSLKKIAILGFVFNSFFKKCKEVKYYDVSSTLKL